jgi:hypothetical protein
MSSHDSASRAAELAAQQVESIVAAAQQAAEEMEEVAARKLEDERAKLEAEFAGRRERLEAEIEKLRETARTEADKEKREAHEQAVREREAALAEAKRMLDEAQTKAEERVAAAEKAADEALADARAISSGLRRLGQSLESYAEQILRDVQGGHRRMRANLRVATDLPAAEPGATPQRAEGPRRRAAADRPARSGGENPFDEIDLPDWVARDE